MDRHLRPFLPGESRRSRVPTGERDSGQFYEKLISCRFRLHGRNQEGHVLCDEFCAADGAQRISHALLVQRQ